MDISEIREKIDKVDDQLLQLFLERMALSENVAAYKNERQLPIESKTRERAILANVMERSGKYEQYAFHLFSTLFNLSKARQSELYSAPTRVREQVERALSHDLPIFPKGGTVACQGVEGGNSQEACDKLFPRGRLLYVKTFEAVFDAVESGLCQYGVLPIENSSNGSVRSVYALLRKKRFSIVRSTVLRIHHELLTLPGARLEDIRTIYSHEQAIGQCHAWLKTLPNVRVVPCANTAVAAKLVAEGGDSTVAAIASHRCAELYGLQALRTDIQDAANNYTQFICIEKEPKMYAGANRISLILACQNKPGALCEMLDRLSARDVNMTKLESCPVAGSDFEFIFFMELDATVRDPGVLGMLEEMERNSGEMLFLGCYTAE